MLLKYYSVMILCFYVVNGETGEPKCFSRFDYDEKMLMKQLRFEDKVQKFEDFINGVKAREAKEKEERDKLFAAEFKEFMNEVKTREEKEREERDQFFAAELEKVKNFQEFINKIKGREEKETEKRSSLFVAELEKYKQEYADEIKRQKNVTSEMLENMANSKMEFEKVHEQMNERMKGKIVAFTVTFPKAGATATSMSFTTVITNEGNAFDTSTGKFTCPVSGLYYFSLHIVKKRSSSVGYAGCYIKLNGSSKVEAYMDPQDGEYGADYGSYGVSTSVYLNLKVGDEVTIEGSAGTIPDNVESWTAFSGYLERQVQ